MHQNGKTLLVFAMVGRVVLPSSPLRSSFFQGVCLVLFVVLGRQVGICSPTEREVIQQAKKFFYTEFAKENPYAAYAKITKGRVTLNRLLDVDHDGVDEYVYIVELDVWDPEGEILCESNFSHELCSVIFIRFPAKQEYQYISTWGRGCAFHGAANLYGDRKSEIIVEDCTYNMGGSGADSYLLVFAQVGKRWKRLAQISISGWNDRIDLFRFVDLDGDGTKEILVEHVSCDTSHTVAECAKTDNLESTFYHL